MHDAMNQTKLGSLIEAGFNIAMGFSINYCANLLILPAFGFKSLTPATNFLIGIVYTVISVIRQYTIRRWFNAKLHSAAMRLAGVAR